MRIIAATNQSLPDRVKEGAFRKDLYYRLNVFPIHLPPLRERPEDIPELAFFFLHKKRKELGLPTSIRPTIAEMEKLQQHDWPGNARELANVIERALIAARRTGIVQFCLGDDPVCLPRQGEAQRPSPALSPAIPANLSTEKQRPDHLFLPFRSDGAMPIVPLETLEREYILYVLRRTNGKIMGKNSAAELLGINGYTLRKRMLKLGIDPKKRHELLFS